MINYTPPPGAEWLANAVVFYTDMIGRGIEFIHDQFQEKDDQFKTAEDVRSYARRIQKTDPSLASDLIAAANRHEDVV